MYRKVYDIVFQQQVCSHHSSFMLCLSHDEVWFWKKLFLATNDCFLDISNSDYVLCSTLKTSKKIECTAKPSTHWQQSLIQYEQLCWTGNKSATKSNVQLCWMYQQRRQTSNSVAGCQLFLPVQQSRPCWIQLCHQCVPGFRKQNGNKMKKSKTQDNKLSDTHLCCATEKTRVTNLHPRAAHRWMLTHNNNNNWTSKQTFTIMFMRQHQRMQIYMQCKTPPPVQWKNKRQFTARLLKVTTTGIKQSMTFYY